MEDRQYVDTDRLPVRIRIKGYKEMCELLGEEVKAGNSKVSQVKNWRRYFDWIEETRYKYYVVEIYESPKPLIDGRVNNGGANAVPYIPLYKELLLHYVVHKHYEYIDDREILVSPNVLLKSMGLLDNRFFQGRFNYQRVAKEMGLNDKNVMYSFKYINDQIRDHTRKALRELVEEGKIEWDMPYWVSVYDEGTERSLEVDRYGVEYYKYTLNGEMVKGNRQAASEKQVEYIERCREEAERECEVRGIVLNDKKQEVRKRVGELLFERYKIGFYWQKYWIRVSEDCEVWGDVEYVLMLGRLHESMRERLLSNFRNRQNNRSKRARIESEKEIEEMRDRDFGGEDIVGKNEVREKCERMIGYNERQYDVFERVIEEYMRFEDGDRVEMG